MPDKGIFVKEPFYKKADFWRNAVAFGLLGLFVLIFWNEFRLVFEFILGRLAEGQPLSEVLRAVGAILINLGGNLIYFVLGLWLVSQFVLPVQTQEERQKVFERLTSFFSGGHGPAVFIKEGKQIAKAEELQSSLPGVAFVDLCSAVALERDWVPVAPAGSGARRGARRRAGRSVRGLASPVGARRPRWRGERVRIAGPGIVFTEWGQKIRGVVDLRRQFRLIPNVHFSTRDGFDIFTHVFALFTLGEEPEVLKVTYVGGGEAENLRAIQINAKDQIEFAPDYHIDEDDKGEIHRFVHTYQPEPVAEESVGLRNEHYILAPYQFADERVFAAIYSQARRVAEGDLIPWYELPPRVAVETLRNLLSLESYDELYLPQEAKSFPLVESFKPKLSTLVRNQGVLSFQFVQRKDGKPLVEGDPWDEDQLELLPVQKLRTSKVLRDRGIKLIAVGFPELHPTHPGIRKHLVDYWRAHWQKEAELTEADHALEAMRVRGKARAEAQEDMIYTLSRVFDMPTRSREALLIRLFQALENYAEDPKTKELLPDHVFNLLWDLRQYIVKE